MSTRNASDVREFLLPDLGEGLEEGEILAWHVDVGDAVELNQPIVEVETAKAVVAVPCPFAGTVVERVGEVGDTLEVGSVLLRVEVGDPSAAPQETSGSDPVDDEQPRPLVGYGDADTDVPSPRPQAARAGNGKSQRDARPLAKPPVRKLAKDLGVDLAVVRGTGPDGVITREDVQAAAGAQPSHIRERSTAIEGFRGRRPGEVEPIRAIRKRIVEKMEAAQAIPTASAACDIDASRLWELKGQLTTHLNELGHDVKITPFVLVMRATVLALRRFPMLNARIVGRDPSSDEPGEIHFHEELHLGFAVDTERGLVVPNIKHADRLDVVELAREAERLATSARDGTITPQEVTGGTFTANNYGSFGNDDAEPVINHPEAGILGIGSIRPRPWVVDGQLTVRHVARVRLVFDHRVCDGGEAGRFVRYVAELCEHPERVLLHG